MQQFIDYLLSCQKRHKCCISDINQSGMLKKQVVEKKVINDSGQNLSNSGLPASGKNQPMMTKILLIEDEEPVRENVLELLEAEGFEAIAAENGLIGLELARQLLPDLILCDLRMPELDGYGVLKALRSEAKTKQIPVMFLTAKAAKTDLSFGLDLGADAYITKPFFFCDLLSAIAMLLKT